MLPIPAYPRDRWPMRLGIVTAILSVGLVLGYGIPVTNRIIAVTTTQEAAGNTAEANHFWRMVAGQDPIDGSDLGRVAALARNLGRKPNPIEVMRRRYIGPGELPNLEDRLGFHAFDRPADQGTGTKSDEGHFTDRFILDTIQALSLTPDSSVDDLLRPVPEVPSYGLLRWDWGVEALAGWLGVCGLFGLWLRRNRRRWPARAKARAVAALTDEQRQVYELVKALEVEPASEQRDELVGQAKTLFADMRQGLDTRDKLAELQEALTEAAETWNMKREVYSELMRKSTQRKDRG